MGSKERSHLHIPTRRQTTPVASQVAQGVSTVTPEKQKITHPVTGLLTRQKRRISIGLVVAILILTLLAIKLTSQGGEANADIDRSHQPTYQTILPVGKSIQQLGGWQRISPDDKDPVYAYADTIGSVSVAVSQQPIPSDFSGDADAKVAEVAKKFSATKKLSTASGTAYLGSSAKGPQSVILSKNNILILIKSQEAIDTQAWVAYIDSLGLSY